MRWRTCLVTAAIVTSAALAVALLPCRTRAADEGVARIREIRFVGNHSVGAGTLRRAMRMKQPVWWNPFRETPYLGPDYLSSDLFRVLDVYRSRGFPLATIRRADVTLIDAAAKAEIEIEVDEGPQVAVRDVRLIGAGPEMAGRATRAIDMEPGGPYSKKKCEETKNRLTDVYAREGHLGATVHHDLLLTEDGAEVQFRVREGPQYRLGEVLLDTTAASLRRTRSRVVRREVAVKNGEVLRSTDLLDTQERIFEADVFRSVRVVPVIDSAEAAIADLRITVSERPSGWYGFGLGYSSDDRARIVAEWGNRNVSGLARRLEADGEISYPLDRNPHRGRPPLRSARAQVRYVEPWIFGTRTRSVLTLYHSYDNDVSFDQDITGLEETLERRVGRTTKLALGVTNKWVRTGDETVTDGEYITRNVSALLRQDRRDNPLDPTTGAVRDALGEYAGGVLGGRAEFSRWSGSVAQYVRLGRHWTFATRVRAGVIFPVGQGVSPTQDTLQVARVPYEERFRLGGGTSVRGYPEGSLGRLDDQGQSIGGSALLLGNIELRFPIVWLIHGAVFLDAGNVWADPKEVKASRFIDGLREGKPDLRNVRYSVGGGVRFITPIGPFRMDYGARLGSGLAAGSRKGEVHLSLGQAF